MSPQILQSNHKNTFGLGNPTTNLITYENVPPFLVEKWSQNGRAESTEWASIYTKVLGYRVVFFLIAG